MKKLSYELLRALGEVIAAHRESARQEALSSAPSRHLDMAAQFIFRTDDPQRNVIRSVGEPAPNYQRVLQSELMLLDAIRAEATYLSPHADILRRVWDRLDATQSFLLKLRAYKMSKHDKATLEMMVGEIRRLLVDFPK